MEQKVKLEKNIWLAPYQFKNDYQYYRQWITEAWMRQGGDVKEGLKLPWRIRMLFGKLRLVFSFPVWLKKKERLIVCCGGFPDYQSWPYTYRYDIVPIVWDCWPEYHSRLIASLQRNKIHTVFFTSSQMVNLVKQTLPKINAFWLPEGIDTTVYKLGDLLRLRSIDLLELGRQEQNFHRKIVDYQKKKYLKNHQYQRGNELLFADFETLTYGLADAKITVCFPRCDTHPEIARNIETMTQRYWECMLSRTLIVGRAPQELINFCGYNPVITVDFDSLGEQIELILAEIDTYQELVDKNRKTACRLASWDTRIKLIKDCLS